MYSYSIVDAHCDTVGEIYQKTSLKKSAGHLDLPRMRQYKNWMQFFAVWVDAGQGIEVQAEKADAIISRFYAEMEENKGFVAPVTDKTGIMAAWKSGKAAALLAIEGADFIDSIEKLYAYYKKGVRAVTLTWNNNNCIATGAGDKCARTGLTEYGRKFVREMNALGMIVDVSHASERTFWDVIETSSAPITASHSNSAAVCAHGRNLTDEQFLALCRRGGVAGINYYPLFLNNTDSADINDIVRHIEHFMSLGGEDHIGLGGDFDGVDTLPLGLRGAQDVYKLLDELLRLGYTEKQVKKIAGENMLRLMGEVLG